MAPHLCRISTHTCSTRTLLESAYHSNSPMKTLAVPKQADCDIRASIIKCGMHDSAWCRPWGSPVIADFAFPGERAGWAGDVENGPRGGRCYYCGRLRQSAPSRLRCSAGLVSTTVRRSCCSHSACPAHACVVAGMLDDGTHSQSAGLHARQVSCCWASSAPPSDPEATQQFARGAREGHFSRDLPPLDGLV